MTTQILVGPETKSSASQIFIKTLESSDESYFNLVEEVFLEKIQPIYGKQQQALNKIKNGNDRICDFIVSNDKPAGLIVYKKELSDELNDFGIRKGIEIKTIFLIEPKIKTAGQFIKLLLSRPATHLKKLNGLCIFGTISALKPDVLRVMCKLGFEPVKIFHDKYIVGVDEYLVCHPFPEKLVSS